MSAPGFDAPAQVSGPVGQRLIIPTHVSHTDGQAAHPSVVYVPDGWNGYRYWMAFTPYPGGVDASEDPNIICSTDGVTWVVPSGLTNPLDDQPGSPGPFNSDTDLRLVGNTMYVIWRTLDRSAPAGAGSYLYYSTSTDGNTWTPKALFWQTDWQVSDLLSPSIVWDGSRWVMYAVEGVDVDSRRVVRVDGSASLAGPWGSAYTVDVGPMQTGKSPWHLYVDIVDGDWVGLLQDADIGASGNHGDLLLLMSDDGLVFRNSVNPIIPRNQPGEHNALYRSCFVREGNGYRVWYTGWIQGPPHIWHLYRTYLTAPAAPEEPDEPEEPPREDVGVATATSEVTWYGCDLITGTIIAELPEIVGQVSRVLGAYTSTNLSMPIPLSGPGSFSYNGVALPELWMQATAPGQTMIVPVVNDVPAAAFIVLSRKGGTGAMLELGVVSLEGYLARRYARDHTWTQKDEAAVIAAGLFGDAQVDGIGLIIDAPPTGTLRDRTYVDGDDVMVYQRLTELMSVQGGPEWTIDVDWADETRTAVAKIARVRKRIGVASSNPDAVFATEGESDATYDYSEDYTEGRGANHVQARGDGEGEDRPVSPAIDGVRDGWPRYERRVSVSGESNVAVLTDHALAELDLRRDGSKVWSIQARWDAFPRLGIDWRLGDDIGLELTGHRHPFGVTEVHRSIGWTLDMQAGTVVPILLEVDDGTG